MSETHYVLLIHGTWTNAPGWHCFDPTRRNFCAVLRDELVNEGISDAVWRSDNEAAIEFNWSGANKHEDRVAAGTELAQRLEQIITNDSSARINLVAHSHGCNVTLRAIQRYLSKREDEYSSLIHFLFRNRGGETAIEKAIEKVFGKEAESVKKSCSDFFDALRLEFDKRRTKPEDPDDSLFFFETNASKTLRQMWLASPRNRIGRVVFLGPPFLRKVWFPRPKLGDRAIRILDFSGGFLITFFVAYGLSMFIYILFWLLALPLWLFKIFLLDSPEFNPLQWSMSAWILIPILLLVFIIASVVATNAASSSKRIDKNLYFDDGVLHTSLSQPIETLVVTADLLDEVLLGFSSEPLVYGALLPKIREFFNPKVSLSWPPRPIGYSSGLSEDLWEACRIGFRVLMGGFWWCLRPVTRVWERVWTKRLMQLISASAFGLQLHEFDRALILASSTLGMPDYFAEIKWDVTKLLIAQGVTQESQAEQSNRYSFLWETSEFDRRRQASWIWKSIEPHQSDIERRYNQLPSSEGRGGGDGLSRACVVLEERFGEAIGAVGLMHTAYQSNKSIVEVLARFLARGELPKDGVQQTGAVTATSSVTPIAET